MWDLLFQAAPHPSLPQKSPASSRRLSYSGLFSPLFWESLFSNHLKILIICSTTPVSSFFLSWLPVFGVSFQIRKESAVEALFIICPWRLSADFFELKTGRLAAKTRGGGSSWGWCVCAGTHTYRTHLASRSKWIKRKEIQIHGKRGKARSVIETPYKFGEKKTRKEGMRGEGKNSER